MPDYQEMLMKAPSTKTVEFIYTSLEGTALDKKNCIDLLFRKALLETMHMNQQMLSSRAMELCLLCLTLTESNFYCTSSLPFSMLADMFDSLCISEVSGGLDFLSNILPRLLQEPLYSVGKYHLLRVCNDLLKRLSKVREYVICGRIQMMLARIFPLNEKSALNLTSEFNTDKISYVMLEDSSNDTIDTSYNSSSKDRKCTEDFYTKLWGIQDCIGNPNVVFMSESSWSQFVNDTNMIIHVFRSYATSSEGIARHSNNYNKTPSSKTSLSLEKAPQFFFPKYITNPKLISLQMDYLNFRLQILFQFLILLTHFRSKGKFQSQEIPAQHLNWCADTISQIIEIFEQYDNIYASNFLPYVMKVCKNEEFWIEWKNEGCPSLHISPKIPTTNDNLSSLPTALDLQKWDFSGKVDFLNPRLNYLWNLCLDNMDSCKAYHKNVVAPLTLSGFIHQHLDDLGGSSDSHHDLSDNRAITQPWFQWRVLRLLADHCSHFFASNNLAQTTVSSYIEAMIPLALSNEESPNDWR